MFSSDRLILSDKVYNFLKWLTMILLPASATLYFTLGNAWGWGAIEQVVGSIAAFATFIGAIVGISSSAYNSSDTKFDGAINTNFTDEGVKVFELELNEDPDAISDKNSILFKVNPTDESQ